jgi:PadR family transcriptional regulator AphA
MARPLRDLSPTGRVILGMIRMGARTGYDIKALVDHSTRFFWAASYGQIYPELRRLEAAGLVRAASPAGGRRRTEYELTREGEAALADWLADTGRLAYELRDEGLLKLFFADAMPREVRLAHLRAMRERHERTVARLREIEPLAASKREQGAEFPLVVLRSGIAFHEFIAAHCRRLEEEI